MSEMSARIVWDCVLAILSCAPMLALDPHHPLGQLYHTSWNAKSGLNGSVLALAQTTDGFLWVGTTDGLLRFDGLSFERYKPEAGSLLATSVSSLLALPEGGLWIGYTRGGVSFLKDGRVTNYSAREGVPAARVRGFARGGDGTLWAAFTGGLARLEGQRWQIVQDMKMNYPARSASAVFADSQGTLWVGSGSGILFLPKGAENFQDTGLHTGRVRAFARAPDGTIFFSEDGERSVRAFRFPMGSHGGRMPLLKILARRMLFDRDGGLWLAGNGVSRLPVPSLWSRQISESSSDVETFTERQGLTDNTGETILEDREGNIWVGTDGGLDRFRRRNLFWFPFPEGTHSFSLVAGDRGDVWAGSWGDTTLGVLRVQDGKQLKGGPKDVRLAYRDPAGTIWFAGLDIFVKWTQAGLFSIPPPDAALRLAGASAARDPIFVGSITKDWSGALWVAYGGSGEFQLKDGAWKFRAIVKGHEDWTSTWAFTDAGGRIWLAYPELIAQVDGGTARTFSAQEGLEVGPFSIIVGRDEQIWVGGQRGLAFFQGGRFHTLKTADGGGLSTVTGIVAPPNDGLWVSASPGIVHIPDDEVQHALRKFDYQVNYQVFDMVSDLPDQLQREGTATSGVIQATDGVLWFATCRGAARVDPAHIYRNPLPPPVTIRSLIADDKPYSTFKKPVLPPLTKSLQIDYTALSLSIPERVRFRYKLEGSDKTWQEAGARRQAFYTNLKPGPYQFHVVACNNDGVWNDSGAALDFRIAPAFYQTIWFQSFCWASGAGVLWLFYLLRLKQVHAQLQARLNERLEERTRIARDLHDTLLQSFHGLLMRFQAAVNLLPGRAADARQVLEAAVDDAAKAITEARDAVQGMRSSTEITNELYQAVEVLGHSLAEQQRAANGDAPAFSVEVEGASRDLHPILRDEVYRMTGEAMRNAFRHARARRIEVEIRYDARELRVRVRDDGIGIDASVLQEGRAGHYGLPGMCERAKSIGGQLEVWSEQGAGTELELTVPAKVAYGGRGGRRFRLFAGKEGTTS